MGEPTQGREADRIVKRKPVRFERDGLPTAVLDAREAAAYLAISQITLYRWSAAGSSRTPGWAGASASG